MQRNDPAMDGKDIHKLTSERLRGPTTNRLDLRVLGVCTGAALNTLSFALLHYGQSAPDGTLRINLLQHGDIEVHQSIRTPILNLLRDVPNTPTLAVRINALLGLALSDGTKSFCQKHEVDIASIDIVGTSASGLGHFSFHPPGALSHASLGWNEILSQHITSTIAHEFSVLEKAGFMASLSPVAFVDSLLLRHPTIFRACITVEELVNITFIENGNAAPATISRECGPGCLLIDYAVKYCTSNDLSNDCEGKYASKGQVNQGIVDRFLSAYDYSQVQPSPNIAREMFGDHEAQRLIDECIYLQMSEADTIATVTAVTAQNITKQFLRLSETLFQPGHTVDELFICGLGARNSSLIEMLENTLPEKIITKPLDDIGIPGDANEAVCYAHLAFEVVISKVTRSLGRVDGNIIQGENWEGLVKRAQDFSEGTPLQVSRDILITSNLSQNVSGLVLRE